MANTDPEKFKKGHGDKVYAHAKPRKPGERENWLREDEVTNKLRQKEYEQRYEYFKKRQGLQKFSEFKNTDKKYEFNKGDTLYPVLKDFYGMNEHTAFLVLTKMLAAGVNVDLWRPKDKIIFDREGNLRINRSDKPEPIRIVLFDVLNPSVRAPEPSPKSAPPESLTPPIPEGKPAPKLEPLLPTGGENVEERERTRFAARLAGISDRFQLAEVAPTVVLCESGTYNKAAALNPRQVLVEIKLEKIIPVFWGGTPDAPGLKHAPDTDRVYLVCDMDRPFPDEYFKGLLARLDSFSAGKNGSETPPQNVYFSIPAGLYEAITAPKGKEE